MKNLSRLLLSSIFTLSSAYALEVNVNVEHINYTGGHFDALEYKTEIGSMKAKSFRIKTDASRFSLQSGYRFNAQVFADSEWIYLANEMFDFSYSLEELPALKKVKTLDVENLSAYTDDRNVFLTTEMAKVFLEEETVFLKNVFLSCQLEENIIDGSEKIAESCLNSSRFSKSNSDAQSETRIEAEFGDSSVGLNIASGVLTEDSIDITASNVGMNFGSFGVGADSVNLECSKTHYTEDVTGEEVTRHCLKDANITIPQLALVDEEINLQGLLNIDKFLSDGEKLKFEGRSVDITYDGLGILISELDASCFLPSLDENFQYAHISEGCMTGSDFKLTEFSLTTEETRVSLGETKLNVGARNIRLNSPLITFEDRVGSLKINIMDSIINCKKVSNEQPTLESILRGCFDSSKLYIPRITLSHDEINSTIKINRIGLDKNKIDLNSPKGSYTINKIKSKFKDISLNCNLDASYDMAKNLDWKSILQNCLHSSVFKIKSLVGVYKGDSVWKTIENKVSTFGIKGMQNVDYNSRDHSNDDFILKISPEILGFIPINTKIKGDINFDKEKSEIIIKINKAKLYGFIPAKFLVELILKAFIEEDNIQVDDDVITVNLNNE